MKTLISIIGGTPQIQNDLAVKIAGKTGSEIFSISNFRFSQSTEPGSPHEKSAWKTMTDQIMENDSVVLKNDTLTENLVKLHQNANFDTHVLVLSGSAKEVEAAKNLKAGHVIAVGALNAKAVAESVQKYLLQEKGII